MTIGDLPEPLTEEQDGVGIRDAFTRLYTPHRLAYIKGEDRPAGEGCPFCTIPGLSDEQGLVVARGAACFAVLNLYPYNSGHLMVVPYRHVSGYDELTADNQFLCDLDGNVVPGSAGSERSPSSDTAAHAHVYREMPEVGGVVHTHSTYAAAWAARGESIPCVLTAMADGQLQIVPTVVRTHVEGCRSCTTHLGNAALLSLHTGREIALVARAADASARAPLPRLFIALGLAFAVLGLVPRLADAPSTLGSAKTFAIHDVPMLVNGLGTLGRRLLEPGSAVGLALTYGAAALLVIMAFVLVRLLPQKEVSR